MDNSHYYHQSHNQYQQAYANELAKIEYSLSDYYCQHTNSNNNLLSNNNNSINYSEYASNVNEPLLLNDQTNIEFGDFKFQYLDNNNSSSLIIPQSNNSDPRSNSVTSDFSIDSLTSNFYSNNYNINNNSNNKNVPIDLSDMNKSNNQYFQQQAAISNYEPIINKFENDDFTYRDDSISTNDNIKKEYFNNNNNEISNDGNVSDWNYHEHHFSNINTNINNSGKTFNKLPVINYNDCEKNNPYDKNEQHQINHQINIPGLYSDYQAVNIDYNSYLSSHSTHNHYIYKQCLNSSSPNVIDKSLPSSSNSSASSSFCNYDSYPNSSINKSNHESNFCLINQIDMELNNKSQDQNENNLPIDFDSLYRKNKIINFRNTKFQYPTNPVRNKNIKARLEDIELWNEFNRLGTEMLITKPGRRMFPFIRYRVSGLDKRKNYIMFVDFMNYDTNRYKFVNNEWLIVSTEERLDHLDER